MKRDESLDFWRGIACIAIILIHTVFHSGSAYIPYKISCWFLLFDIPVFMCIAGMTYSLINSPEKKLKEIINLLKQWVIFLVICYIFFMIFNRSSIQLKDFFSWLAFAPVSYTSYTVSLVNSLWFMVYYIQSSLFCSILLSLLNKNNNNNLKTLINIIILMFFILLSINYNVDYLGFSNQFVEYCIFFMIGYVGAKYNFKNIKTFILSEVILILSLIAIYHVNGFTIENLQDLKFNNMNYIYALSSLISLFFIIYVKDKFKYTNKIITPIKYIGKNAIYMFFAQGISSSLLFFILPYVTISSKLLKLLIMFSINLLIASIIFLLLKLIYTVIYFLGKKLYNIYIYIYTAESLSRNCLKTNICNLSFQYFKERTKILFNIKKHRALKNVLCVLIYLHYYIIKCFKRITLSY